MPARGAQIPLHLNLPHETPDQRMTDGSIRHVGFGGGADGGEDVMVLSLAQIFSANYYSFLADALARLVVALDATAPDTPDTARTRLRIALPADSSKLKPWMWTLLERLGVGKELSFPYAVRPIRDSTSLKRAAAARVRAARLLVVDWLPDDHDNGACYTSTTPSAAADLAHLPSRAALRLLRERMAFPGAHLAWSSPRHTIVYLQVSPQPGHARARSSPILLPTPTPLASMRLRPCHLA